MACTLGPLVEEVNEAAAEAAYEICEVDPSGLTLPPEDASEINFTTTLGKDDSEYDVFGQMGKQFEMY